MNRTKILYVILDGAGDRPIAALDGRTPLEAAATPHLDRLAAAGQQGLVTTVGEGIAPESDVAVTAVLGYDPMVYHAGRGPLEALGADLPFGDGDLALRGNFATGGEGRRILDRRVGRNLTSEEAHALADAVTAQIRLESAPATVVVAASIGHRCAVVFHPLEGRLSAKISNTDPAYGRVGGLGVALATFRDEVAECVPLDDSPEARTSAALVNEFTWKSRAIMDAHPVNARRRAEGKPPGNLILVRDGGDHLPSVPPMRERFGVRLGCFVEMPVERGIARYLGMGIVEVPYRAAAGRSEVYQAWARRALEVLPQFDGLYLHLKGPDEPGHDGDCAAKRRVIEEIDAHFFGTLLPGLALDETVVAVTADHATPCELRGHSADPVPLLVSGAGTAPDRAGRFTESAAGRGALGHLRGVEVLPLLVSRR
ncbi:MAG: 2,3-bisphosphoglycerate-independent phosphoglycerate mutase [Armatimonadota bacterium]|nr:2,3-bisphosphoglycerate-independent phosphoglycerate mutase [Armatimonadota bacterium]MDR7518245.1 2,3-bisphosphoglycerate-independent phosphoglycerate mutase [Armatimonadota bacterium]MDR7548669.1 2,3-bisphosphoglycerate-independent phosphoglycerate mutase [Armatimonadota bacterium]